MGAKTGLSGMEKYEAWIYKMAPSTNNYISER